MNNQLQSDDNQAPTPLLDVESDSFLFHNEDSSQYSRLNRGPITMSPVSPCNIVTDISSQYSTLREREPITTSPVTHCNIATEGDNFTQSKEERKSI